MRVGESGFRAQLVLDPTSYDASSFPAREPICPPTVYVRMEVWARKKPADRRFKSAIRVSGVIVGSRVVGKAQAGGISASRYGVGGVATIVADRAQADSGMGNR